MIVYGLVDPRSMELRYVGQTVRDLKRRFAQHLLAASKGTRPPVNAWLRSLAISGATPATIVLDVCESRDALNESEIWWIEYARFLGCALTNLARGGDSRAGWREYVTGLSPLGEPPEVIARGYSRTLRVLYLAWLDASVIKLAELAALANLESAIKCRYHKRFKGLESALNYLVEQVGVTDADLLVVRECSGSVVANLLKMDHGGPALSEVRNQLAHGDPFETMPRAGLFEVVRDLIDFMYPPASTDKS